MEIYGYIRVSTKEQNEERQYIAMEEFGVDKENIFADKQSGKDFERPGYRKLKSILTKQDVLVVQSIDRLGRNYEEIIEEWRSITKDIGAAIVVIDMPLLDTRKEQDLAGTLISDIVLQLLSYVAQAEREFTRKRQAEGIAAARARGVHMGRLKLKRPRGYKMVYEKWKQGSFSATRAARELGVSRNTFLSWARDDKGSDNV